MKSATRKPANKRAAKAAAKKFSAGARSGSQSGETRLRDMIAAKKAKLADGSLEVALAIASITQLVTVDATTDPFSIDPDDLFTLTFNDPKVGLDDDDIAIFKANLAVLLPSIAGDIAEIEENANVDIGLVVDFVTVSLLAAGAGGTQ